MKTTEQCITYLSTHPWLKKGFLKLKKNELEILVSFLSLEFSSKEEAALACNRMFLDKEELPKNWTTIQELTSSSITFRY